MTTKTPYTLFVSGKYPHISIGNSGGENDFCTDEGIGVSTILDFKKVCVHHVEEMHLELINHTKGEGTG